MWTSYLMTPKRQFLSERDATAFHVIAARGFARCSIEIHSLLHYTRVQFCRLASTSYIHQIVETLPNEPRRGWSINCRSAIELSHRDEIIGSLSSLPPFSHLCAIERGGCRRPGLHWLCVDGYWQIPQPENVHKWLLQ